MSPFNSGIDHIVPHFAEVTGQKFLIKLSAFYIRLEDTLDATFPSDSICAVLPSQVSEMAQQIASFTEDLSNRNFTTLNAPRTANFSRTCAPLTLVPRSRGESQSVKDCLNKTHEVNFTENLVALNYVAESNLLPRRCSITLANKLILYRALCRSLYSTMFKSSCSALLSS